MITAHHLVFGRQYSQTKEILFLDGGGYNQTIIFSTRNGNATVFRGQQNQTVSYIPSKNVDLTLTTGNITNSSSGTNTLPSKITFLNGFKDVYSFKVGSRMNISSIKDFFKDFTNLYSINFDYEGFGGVNVVGSLTDIPDSVERVHKSVLSTNVSTYTLSLDVSNFSTTSNLKYFHFVVNLPTTSGNLAKLPSQLYYFKLAGNAGTFTYSGTKVWASSFDTLDLGNASLSYTETDNLFIDMANSITTAIGSKVIRLANCYRTTASNTAVAYLQGLGYTITVANYELAYKFDGNFNDVNGINNLVQNGTITFTTDRKGGNTAVQFGSGFLQTINNLPASSIWSISFWINTTQTSLEGYLFYLTTNYYSNNAFVSELNFQNVNKLLAGISASPHNFKTLSKVLNDNNWHHIVLIFDRGKSATDEIKIYIDNVLQTLSIFNSNNGDHTGNFVSDKLYIGAVGSNLYKYQGKMSDIKIFNYPLNQAEITNLYNE